MEEYNSLSDNKKYKILFVCLGNICRSPAAEGVMRTLVENAGRGDEFVIDSAGIGGWHVGQLPDSRMRRRGAVRGYRFDSRARQLCGADFSRFDLILVMDNANVRAVKAMASAPEQRDKVRMLGSYMTSHAGVSEIPDPYYGDDSDFDYALDLIEDACRGCSQRCDLTRISRHAASAFRADGMLLFSILCRKCNG